MNANRELVDLGDLDELARHVDRLAAGEWWPELFELRDLCRKALERGKQLWPIAARAEYRLALDAPAVWVAKVLVPGAGRFALGPLPEVAAAHHVWADVAPVVDHHAPEPAFFAHERVLHDEDLRDDGRVAVHVLEIPLALQPWEPDYPLADYEPDRAQFPIAPDVGLASVRLPAAAAPADDGDTVRALRDLSAAWTSESNGRSEAVAVRGGAFAAVATLGVSTCRAVEVSPSRAMARMAWTGASGGAHGRRRGMATGRFAAWWAATALTGLHEDWPVDPDELGEAMDELRWYVWDPGGADTGWSLRLAVEDPADGLAWAVSSTDAAL